MYAAARQQASQPPQGSEDVLVDPQSQSAGYFHRSWRSVADNGTSDRDIRFGHDRKAWSSKATRLVRLVGLREVTLGSGRGISCKSILHFPGTESRRSGYSTFKCA